MKTRFARHCLCAVTGLGLVACASTQEDAAEDTPTGPEETHVLAETEIAGGNAKFVAFDAQTLLITTDTVGVPNPLHDPEVRGLDAVKLYEHWAGKAAPPQLVELATKTSQKAEAGAEREAEVGAVSSALTGEERDEMIAAFQENHCPSLGAEQFCWTDRTGTWEYSERARYWSGWVNAMRGDVSVQMRRRETIGGWTPVWSSEVLEGHDQQFAATSEVLNQRQLKFKIFEADDDLWNFAGTWD